MDASSPSMKLRRCVLVAASTSLLRAVAGAQHEHAEAPGARPMEHRDEHASMDHAMPALLGPYAASREASGTSWVPESSAMHGLHRSIGAWSAMFHGFATIVADHQGGRRGDDGVLSTNMFMAMGSRALGAGRLGLRAMLSLEPATVGDEGYPLLFQTGETSNGTTPLVDAQHPHDLFMELAATYSVPIGERSSAFAYLALPGEPALGPPTFMHRFSGMENPEAPLGHHWLDSTHVSFGVATIGWTWDAWKLDASAFNGREPDEHRWDVEEPELDSESVRLSWNPSAAWAFQASVGDLHAPEQLEPDVDVTRATVSAMYDRAWDGGHWQTTLAAGRNDDRPGRSTDALLLETALASSPRDTWLARVESVEKDELFEAPDPLAGRAFRVEKLSLGYLREIARVEQVSIAIGVLGSVYRFDDALDAAYGDDPRSILAFLRVRL